MLIEEYDFPYWDEKDRVNGQSTKDLNIKYSATYKRVAEMMVANDFKKFQHLNSLGLFATNYLSIPDYLSRCLNKKNHEFKLESTVVIENNSIAFQKIKKKMRDCPDPRVRVIPTSLKNLLVDPTSPYNKPLGWDSIRVFQKLYQESFSFIDLDLMCNWSRSSQVDYLPRLINKYSSSNCIVHINAISSCPRSMPWARTEKEIKDIFNKTITPFLTSKVLDSNFRTYATRHRNTTLMTSAVFYINRI